jgi:hypothetical protein
MALITYVLAASSNVAANTIPKIVYDNGWAVMAAKNGKLLRDGRMDLFRWTIVFSHYSFLGINLKI